MDKQQDVMAILKLYELRRDEKMRAAQAWYFPISRRNRRWILSNSTATASSEARISAR